MPTFPSMPIRDALRQRADGALSPPALMRHLASHDAWIAPAALLGADAEPDEGLVLGDPGAALGDTAYLYTDRNAVEAASGAGVEAGRLVVDVSATRALAALSSRLETLEINAGSADEARWTVRHRHFPMLRLWAQTVATERGLEAATEAERKVELVRGYPGWIVLAEEGDGQTPRAMTWPERTGQLALAFTATDQLAAYATGQRPDVLRMRGEDIVERLVALRFRGVVVNPGADVPAVVPLRS